MYEISGSSESLSKHKVVERSLNYIHLGQAGKNRQQKYFIYAGHNSQTHILPNLYGITVFISVQKEIDTVFKAFTL